MSPGGRAWIREGEPEPEGEVRRSDGVEEWRYEELVRAGMPPDDALHIAGRKDIDLHVAVELVRRVIAKGEDVSLAASILK